jgi:hypothetical protein
MQIIIFVGVAILIVAAFLAWRSMDRGRITDYIEERGGRVESIDWSPFGTGWFGDKSDAIYEVVYYDKDGAQHVATCKTAVWSGVYWTEDNVTEPAFKAKSEKEWLEAENVRLREELRRLKQDRN